jgi:hypothetical protein
MIRKLCAMSGVVLCGYAAPVVLHAQNAQAPSAVVSGRHRNPPPPMPFVVPGVCPGEGCELGRWLVCRSEAVRSLPHRTAPVAFQLRRGEHVTAQAAEMHVDSAGLVVFTRTVRIVGLDAPDNPTIYTPADTLYPLYWSSDEGEVGQYWFHGHQIAESWFGPDAIGQVVKKRGMHLVRRSYATWWVQVRTEQGRTGWVGLNGEDTRSFAGVTPHYEDNPPRCHESQG